MAHRNEVRAPARLGLAIAKKQVKRASRRNLLKRLARECFRISQQKLGGLDLVVMARAAAATAPRERLNASLQKHFERLTTDLLDQ